MRYVCLIWSILVLSGCTGTFTATNSTGRTPANQNTAVTTGSGDLFVGLGRGSGLDFNQLPSGVAGAGAVRWVDGPGPNLNGPENGGNTVGILFQLDPLWNSAPDLYKMQIANPSDNNVWQRAQVNGTWGGWQQFVMANSSGNVVISGNVTAPNFTMTSDRRFKKDIEPLENQIDKIIALNSISFKWNKLAAEHGIKDTKSQLGFIAQDVERDFPQAVRTAPDGYKSVNYPALMSPLVKAFQEFYAKWDSNRADVEQKLREKDAKVEALEKRVELLERQLVRQFQAKE